MPQLHIRYQGESTDIELHEIDLGDMSNDTQVRTAAATYLNIPTAKFVGFAVDRNTETGDVTLRPQAIYG